MRLIRSSSHGAAAVVAMVVAGVATVVSSAPFAAADTTAPVSTVWKLVNTVCGTNQAAAGRACYDTSGYLDPSTWQVNETSATWDEGPGYWTGQYTYQLPDSVAHVPGEIPLTVQSTSDNNAGANLRMCAKQGSYLAVSDTSGDPCVEAGPNGKGTASASVTLTITPTEAPNGTLDVVWISIQDGPGIYFTYEASNPPRDVTYRFNATEPRSTDDGEVKWDFSGHGTFRVKPPSTVGKHLAGSAVLEKHHAGKTGVVRFDLVKATVEYPSDQDLAHPSDVFGIYEVTHSDLKCLEKGDRVRWHISSNTGSGADVLFHAPSCDLAFREAGSVRIHSSAA